ncbi:hypothetical protein HCN44_008048 [Aphidius gifuensis]|uniref:Alanine--glyoxylate aminotransferase 2, mitochondrial n=2 Tax=Aphidius gifuensis TaxID=684658 RepID=A0A835CNC3_APHGI|nr:hypothetical protein HCN44_008048 [Aphidius gifuensis]
MNTRWLQLRMFSSLPEMPATNFIASPYKGTDYETIKLSRMTKVTPSQRPFYKKPLLIHEGHGQWLWDHTGRRYLDMFGGIVTISVGHSHPKITDIAVKQMSKLCHTTSIYMHPKYHEYVDKLTAKLPDKLNTVYLVNSGSEANELAFLMSRLYTGAQAIVSLRNCYHGGSYATAVATAMSTWKYPMAQPSGYIHVTNPDVYRGSWGGSQCRDCPISKSRRTCECIGQRCIASEKYVDDLHQVFRYTLPTNGQIAGFIAESIQGVGGVVQYPRTYLQQVYNLVKSKGGLCIADEVQTGFGRTGDNYWGFEGHNIVPDIVTLAKGIGNGFPLGAVVTTKEIADCLNKALHFNTFGGNPLACAVGTAVLDIIDEEKLQENSKIVGTHMLHRLSTLMLEYPTIIGDIRGKGLMIGVELVDDPDTKEAMSADNVAEIFEDIKDMGVLVGKGGINGNILRIKPPMCVTKEDVDFTVEVINTALKKYRNSHIEDKESVYFSGV